MNYTYDFHKACVSDNMHQIGRLIYHTDPYIYPFWRESEHQFTDFIEPWLYAEGFLYYYRNFCVISERRDRYPLGIIGGLDAATRPNFDYSVFDDERSEFLISHYIRNVMAERKSIPNDSILITNLCIDPVVRGLGIGYELVNRYIDMMEKRGYRSFRLDCLEDNIPARQMYNKLGFQEIGGGYGFSGPKQTEPKILHLLLEF